MCAELAPVSDKMVITRSVSRRSASPSYIEERIKTKNAITVSSSEKAVETALRLAGPKDLVLVAGSFYLIGEVKKMFGIQKWV